MTPTASNVVHDGKRKPAQRFLFPLGEQRRLASSSGYLLRIPPQDTEELP
jgi:hypothetical protein